MKRSLAAFIAGTTAVLVGAGPAHAATPTDTLSGIGPSGIRWSVAVPQDSPDGQSAPLVSNGVAYLGGQGHTLAVRTSDGATLWEVATPDGGYGRWLDGTAFIVSSLHHVTAYDEATGTLRWQHTENASIAGIPVRTEHDGLAFSTSGGHTTVINLSDGSLRWSKAKQGVDTVVADARTVVSADPSHITAFDAATGKLLWHNTYQSTTPVITQGVVVDGDQKSMKLSGFDLRTGRTLWTRRGLAYATVAGLSGRVLLQPRGELALVNARNGRQLWRVRSGAVDSEQFQSATDSGVLALLDGAGGGHAFATGRSLRTGRVVWTAPVGATETDGAVVPGAASRTLLATTVDDRGGGVVTNYATATGATAWQVTLPEQPVGQAQDDGAGGAVVLTVPAVEAVPV